MSEIQVSRAVPPWGPRGGSVSRLLQRLVAPVVLGLWPHHSSLSSIVTQLSPSPVSSLIIDTCWFRAHADNPGWFRLKILNYVCKDFSKSARRHRFWELEHGHIFWEAIIQPTASACRKHAKIRRVWTHEVHSSRQKAAVLIQYGSSPRASGSSQNLVLLVQDAARGPVTPCPLLGDGG